MATDATDCAMVSATHQMARVVGIRTIAESASSAEVLGRVKSTGIALGQGFWLGSRRTLDELLGSATATTGPSGVSPRTSPGSRRTGFETVLGGPAAEHLWSPAS